MQMVPTVPVNPVFVGSPAVTRPRVLGWERWGLGALILGLLLAVSGLIIQILDIVRIYNGIYNFGLKNFDLTDQLQFPVFTVANAFFLFAERWHFWPWTYAGSAMGLIIMITGLVGIISAYRKSYSLIYSFFAFSLFSTGFSIFLIIYYSIIINYYYRYYTALVPSAEIWNPNNRPDSGDQSYGIVGTNLSFSILSLLLSIVANILASKAGRIGTLPKKFQDYHGNLKHISYQPASIPYNYAFYKN